MIIFINKNKSKIYLTDFQPEFHEGLNVTNVSIVSTIISQRWVGVSIGVTSIIQLRFGVWSWCSHSDGEEDGEDENQLNLSKTIIILKSHQKNSTYQFEHFVWSALFTLQYKTIVNYGTKKLYIVFKTCSKFALAKNWSSRVFELYLILERNWNYLRIMIWCG